MSKIDELKRLLQEAKREEAEKSGGAWMGYLIVFFILVAFGRGCSDDKTNAIQEQVPIEQSVEYESNNDASEDDAEPEKSEVKSEYTKIQGPTPEEKLESMTGEKIETQAEAIEETVVVFENEQEESIN